MTDETSFCQRALEAVLGVFKPVLPLVLCCCGLVGFGAVSQDDLVSVTGTVSIVGAGKDAPDAGNVAIWLTPEDRPPSQRDAIAQPRRFRVQQRDKRFQPAMLVVPVGSTIEFPNEDPFFHNVFSMYNGKRFDLGLYEAGTSRNVTATRPGICYVFCNIHPDMSSVIVVVDTPYYAVSDRNGRFTIPRMPAGRYLLSAWHERHLIERPSEYPREVTVTPTNTQLNVIRFTQSPQLKTRHANKYGHDYHDPNPPGPLYK